MTVQPVLLNIPDLLYDQIKRRAEQTHRSVEAELLDVVTAALPLTDELSTDLNDAISQLGLLDDDALKRAANSHLPNDVSNQLEALHVKRQREGLDSTETQTLASLVRQYERTMLTRAQAVALLKERGYDISQYIGEA